jgi:hypothetical protein
MGPFANPTWLKAVAYTIAAVITTLNVKLLIDSIGLVWVAAIAAAMLVFWLWGRRGKFDPAQPAEAMNSERCG